MVASRPVPDAGQRFETLASSGQTSHTQTPDTPPPKGARGPSMTPQPQPKHDGQGDANLHAHHAPPPHAQPGVGAGAEIGNRNCKACGGKNGSSARFCQLCGSPLERPSSELSRPEPPVVHAAQADVFPHAELVVIAQDGSPGRRYAIRQAQTSVGREMTDISLHKDPYVSPQHAEISYRNGRFYLSDQGSLNGVFVRLGGSIPLTSGDLLLVGLGVLRFEVVEETERNLAPQTRNGTRVFGTPPAPRYARLTVQTVEGVARDRYYLSRAETILGREVGDIVFTVDLFMSRRHAAIRRDPNTNKFSIRDLGSSNGTFIALRKEHALSPGDHIRIGQHLFRLDVRSNG